MQRDRLRLCGCVHRAQRSQRTLRLPLLRRAAGSGCVTQRAAAAARRDGRSTARGAA